MRHTIRLVDWGPRMMTEIQLAKISHRNVDLPFFSTDKKRTFSIYLQFIQYYFRAEGFDKVQKSVMKSMKGKVHMRLEMRGLPETEYPQIYLYHLFLFHL